MCYDQRIRFKITDVLKVVYDKLFKDNDKQKNNNGE